MRAFMTSFASYHLPERLEPLRLAIVMGDRPTVRCGIGYEPTLDGTARTFLLFFLF